MSKDRKVDVGIVQRGDSYRFTVYQGYDSNGKQLRKTKTWKPTSEMSEKKADKEAKKQYLIFEAECKDLHSFNENMKFSALCEEYFRICEASKSIKEITLYNYKSQIKNHFMPFFGNMKLKNIDTKMLTDFFTTYKTNGQTLKPSTVKKMFTVMQSIFTFAVSQGYIKSSPCNKFVKLPKDIRTSDESRKSLTEEELFKFVDLFDGEHSDFDRMIIMLLHTGMRSGELLGLQWEDIDFKRKQIFVNHTLTDISGTHFLTPPKTKSSKRVIAMNDTVYELLKIQRKYQMELINLLPSFAHPEMVFTSSLGNYKDRSALYTSFKRFLKNTEFEFMTLHGLRHTNATFLLNQGVDLKIVSEHLGHSDISTTGNIYADVLEQSRRKTAEIIELKMAK